MGSSTGHTLICPLIQIAEGKQNINLMWPVWTGLIKNAQVTHSSPTIVTDSWFLSYGGGCEFYEDTMNEDIKYLKTYLI